MASSRSREGSCSDNLSIRVESNVPKSRLSELGIHSWPKWGCPAGKYKLKFEAEETCYVVRGRVKVYENIENEIIAEFGGGDVVTIPKGLSCTWHVSLPLDKHYFFHSSST